MQDYVADPLLRALAEQLKIPLLQIARLSETTDKRTLPDISIISEQALRLVDGYLLAQIHAQTRLALEPMTSTSVLYDVAQTLEPFAKAAKHEIIIDAQGRTVPVMAHRQSLEAMLALLGTSLIEAAVDGKNAKLILGTHRSRQGIVIGVFSTDIQVSQHAMQVARQLHGRANQPIPLLGHSGGAAVAIADRLGERMQAPLRAYRHRGLSGIGALLAPSHQLRLL